MYKKLSFLFSNNYSTVISIHSVIIFWKHDRQNNNTLKDFLDQVLVVLDGATGTMLQSLCMNADDCSEMWILNHKEEYVSMQKEYVSNGWRVIYAPIFTANIERSI